MTDLSVAKKLVAYKPKNKVRFVTAAALSTATMRSINIMRRTSNPPAPRSSTSATTARWARSSMPRCRKTCRASRSRPTRAAT